MPDSSSTSSSGPATASAAASEKAKAKSAAAGAPAPHWMEATLRVWIPWLVQFLKRAAPGALASLILAVLVVVKPISHFTGDRAFLSIPFLHLFFYPAPATIGAQLETTVLGLIGAALGAGISFLAVAGAVWLDHDHYRVDHTPYLTPQGRAVAAIVLVTIVFAAAYLSSKAPRTKQATRIAIFVTVWILTAGASEISASVFLSLFLPASYAAGASLLANALVFPHTSNQAVARLLAEHVATLQSVVRRSTADFFQHEHAASDALHDDCHQLRRSLADMRRAFFQAMFELSFSRMSTKDYKPLLAHFRLLRGWVACGMGLRWRGSHPEAIAEHHCARFEPAVRMLADSIDTALAAVGMAIQVTLGSKAPEVTAAAAGVRGSLFATAIGASTAADTPDRTVLAQRKQLRAAVERFRDELQGALGKYEAVARQEEGAEEMFEADMYAVAFLMVTLLELANETMVLLSHSQQLLRKWHAHPRRRIHFPAIHLREWFGQEQQGSALAAEEEGPLLRQSSREPDDDVVANFGEWNRDDEEAQLERAQLAQAHWYTRWTRARGVLRARYRLACLVRAIQHSRHLKYAIKMAVGIAVLSTPVWLTDEPGRQWFDESRGQWLLISYVWCLETSTAATFRVSTFRMAGTIVGALVGLIIWEISRGNPYALVVLVGVAELLSALFLVSSSNVTGMGTVFSVTWSVIVFIPYLGFTGPQSHSVVDLAWTRGYQIFLGILAALIVNTLAWPYHARVKLSEQFALATMDLQTLYLSLSRQLVQGGLETSAESTREFEELEGRLQHRFIKGEELVDLMTAEVSIMPKPFQNFSQILAHLQSIADHLMGLRLCREHGMRSVRREVILNVLDLRRDFISSVLISLWVTGQALHCEAPLPQFLPSPRLALRDLTAALREQVIEAEQAGPQPSGLAALALAQRGRTESAASVRLSHRGGSHVRSRHIKSAFFFILAEHALLAEIVEQCEALLELCRTLVGEATFMSTSFVSASTPHYLASPNSSIMHSNQASILRELDRARRPPLVRSPLEEEVPGGASS